MSCNIREESERLKEVLSARRSVWQQELETVESKINELNETLADKESKTDRSENATFQIAKDTRDIQMGSYSTIFRKIEAHDKHKDSYVPTGVITIGTTVEVIPLSLDGEACTDSRGHRVIMIVEDKLSDASNNLIGDDTAIAQALIGLQAGSDFTIRTRKGSVKYKIERIY